MIMSDKNKKVYEAGKLAALNGNNKNPYDYLSGKRFHANAGWWSKGYNEVKNEHIHTKKR